MALSQGFRRVEQVESRGGRGPLWQRIREARWCYLFMAPALVLAVLFTFYPVVASAYFSLLDWSGVSSQKTFVGLANYAHVIHDHLFWDSFWRTLLFAVVDVPIMLAISLVVAIVLNDQTIRLRSVFRTLFFLPVVTTTAIVGVVMSLIMDPYSGPLDAALIRLHLISRPVDFLGNPHIALWAVLGVHIWKWMGTSMIYWLVALQTVPADLYEAAEVDGARKWQLHRFVTVPLIAPFAVIITLIDFVGAMQVFPLIQSMTQGGPAFSTQLIEVYIYRLAFASQGGEPQLGYASTVAVFFGGVVISLAILQAWVARRFSAARRGLRQEENR